jgi:ligand-binding SRPBCC domain-containing protein
MALIQLSTTINAPIERCFDLARSIDLHVKSMTQSSEKAIAGRTNGLIEFGETVTWQAKHLGVQQNLTSKITDFDYPNAFTDEMVSGAFKSFKHQHLFSQEGGQTIMKDVFVFESPLGIIGKLFNYLFLTGYMTKLLRYRNAVIKETAESNS